VEARLRYHGHVLFEPWPLRRLTSPNRVVRAATYEGLASAEGVPSPQLGTLYAELARNDVGIVTTGFCYVAPRGRAMQPRQAGIDHDDKIRPWAEVVRRVRAEGRETLLLMQIAHTGLQTLRSAVGGPPLAPGRYVSPYFRARPRSMSGEDIEEAIDEFAQAARRAREAGFDGVEVHAAHGYLVHQFLSPVVNRRTDRWGRDRMAFLRAVVQAIRAQAGDEFPVFVKLSVPEGRPGGLEVEDHVAIVRALEALGVEAVQVSTGTMDLAFGIFRGGFPTREILEHSPLFAGRGPMQKALLERLVLPRLRARMPRLEEGYNVAAARVLKRYTSLPVVVVGGIRRRATMDAILERGDADAVALARPLICEPDLARRLRTEEAASARCRSCNVCAVMTDTLQSLRCYRPPR